ncbi:hypothetical protein ScPMuIL_009692 [Solemya velum]
MSYHFLNIDCNVSSPTNTNSSEHRLLSHRRIPAIQVRRTHGQKYTLQQLNTLEKVFMANPYPDTDEVERLAGEIGVRERKIKIWFQNKRARWRRRVQNTTQQQTLQPTVVSSASGYPAMPTSKLWNNPTISHVHVNITYPTIPFVPYPSMSSAHDRLLNPRMSTPAYTHHMEQHHSYGDILTTDNPTTHSSPPSSPGSTSCGTIRSLSRNQSRQSPSSPQQSLLQNFAEAKTYFYRVRHRRPHLIRFTSIYDVTLQSDTTVLAVLFTHVLTISTVLLNSAVVKSDL